MQLGQFGLSAWLMNLLGLEREEKGDDAFLLLFRQRKKKEEKK